MLLLLLLYAAITALCIYMPALDRSLSLFLMGSLCYCMQPSLQPWGSYGMDDVDTVLHRQLAMDAALQVAIGI